MLPKSHLGIGEEFTSSTTPLYTEDVGAFLAQWGAQVATDGVVCKLGNTGV